MMGTKTGKIIDYKIRSRTCRICATAKRLGKIPKVHKCRKNYSGSSKSMESDMVVEMVQNAKPTGTKIVAIVGDEDANTIARLRKNADQSITKLSDSNHIKNPREQPLCT